MADEYENFSYIITVRETVDVQYKYVSPFEMTEDERDDLLIKFEAQESEYAKRLMYTQIVRERQVDSIDYIGKSLKAQA